MEKKHNSIKELYEKHRQRIAEKRKITKEERKKIICSIIAVIYIIITLFGVFGNSFSIFADECTHDFDSFPNDNNTHTLKCINCNYTIIDDCTYEEDEFGEWYCSTCGAMQLKECQHSYHYTAQYNNYHNATCTLCGIIVTEPCIYTGTDICILCEANKPTHQHDFEISSNNDGTHTHKCISCGELITEPCEFYYDETDEEYYCYSCGEQKPECYHEIIYISNKNGTHQRQCLKCLVSQTMDCTYNTDEQGNSVCVRCSYIKLNNKLNKHFESVIPWASLHITANNINLSYLWNNTFLDFPNTYFISMQNPTNEVSNITMEKVSANIYDTHANAGYYIISNFQNYLNVNQAITYEFNAFNFIDRTNRANNSYPYVRLGSGARIADNTITQDIVITITYTVRTAVIGENGVGGTRIENVSFTHTETINYIGTENIYLSKNYDHIINEHFKNNYNTQFSYYEDYYIVDSLKSTIKINYNKYSNYSGKHNAIIYNDYYQITDNVTTNAWYKNNIAVNENYIVAIDENNENINFFDGIVIAIDGFFNTPLIGDISLGQIVWTCIGIGLFFAILKTFGG